MEHCLGKEMSNKDEWIKIISVLSFELKLKEKVLLLEKSKPKDNEELKRRTDDVKRNSYVINETPSKAIKCRHCDDIGQVPTITRKGKIIVNHFACPKFAKMNPQETLNELKRKGFCFQYVSPGLEEKHNVSALVNLIVQMIATKRLVAATIF